MTVLRPGSKQPTTATPDPVIVPGNVSFYPVHASGGGIPIMAGQFIPPNGFAGWAQQTAAVQSLYRKRGAGGGTRRRRKKKAAAASGTKRKRKSTRSKSTKARLVKGSAAAKRYMAKIRKKRK